MASAAPKTIGRGGAGNFMSTKDHQPTTTPISPAAPRKANSEAAYTRSGRGGAGNLVSAGTAAFISPTIVPKTAPKGDAASLGHAGRGGAGNWKVGAEEEERRLEDGARRIKRELGERVVKEVESGLMPPPRVYKVAWREGEGFEEDTM